MHPGMLRASQPPSPNGKIIPAVRIHRGGGNIINYQMRSFITIRGGGHTRPRKIRANFWRSRFCVIRAVTFSAHVTFIIISSRALHLRGQHGGRRKRNHDALSLFFCVRVERTAGRQYYRKVWSKMPTNTSRPILIPTQPFFQSTDAGSGIFLLWPTCVLYILLIFGCRETLFLAAKG